VGGNYGAQGKGAKERQIDKGEEGASGKKRRKAGQ